MPNTIEMMNNITFGKFPISIFPNRNVFINITKMVSPVMLLSQQPNIPVRVIPPTTLPTRMILPSLSLAYISMRTRTTTLCFRANWLATINTRMAMFLSPLPTIRSAFSSVSTLGAIYSTGLMAFKGSLAKLTNLFMYHKLIISRIMGYVKW